MSRYMYAFVLVAAFGCKTTGDGAGTALPPASPQSSATMKPMLVAPKEGSPAVVATTPRFVPIVAPQQKRTQLEPAKVSLPVATPSADTQSSMRATADSAIHEVSTVLGELMAIPKSLLPSESASPSAFPANAESKRSALPNADERSSQALPSATSGISVWSYAGPVLTGLCAYILAPLLVDLLKQRMQFARRDVGAAKAA